MTLGLQAPGGEGSDANPITGTRYPTIADMERTLGTDNWNYTPANTGLTPQNVRDSVNEAMRNPDGPTKFAMSSPTMLLGGPTARGGSWLWSKVPSLTLPPARSAPLLYEGTGYVTLNPTVQQFSFGLGRAATSIGNANAWKIALGIEQTGEFLYNATSQDVPFLAPPMGIGPGALLGWGVGTGNAILDQAK